MDNLRYNKVIIATDADVDGMHIRLLMMTFFLQFFPDVSRQGHLFVLQTPLFRVRNKKQTHYCYSEDERLKAVSRCGAIHKGMGPNAEKKVDCLACHPTAGHNYGYVIPFKAAAN